MKQWFNLILIGSLVWLQWSCHPGADTATRIQSEELHRWNEVLEAAIVNDFFTPPVASRIYVYPNIAAYEVLAQGNETYQGFAAFSASLEEIPVPTEQVDLEVAALIAFYCTARKMVYAVDTLEVYALQFYERLRETGYDDQTFKVSKTYAEDVAEHILSWAKADGYPQMRSMPEYQLIDEPGKWKPTLPDYTAAMEPHWPKLRPFVLDSAAQFRPAAPTPFSLDTMSQFHAETMEVYRALINNSSKTEAMAKFWDCNPLVRKHQGHVSFAEKKLTPGGHWVNIARIAMRKENTDLMHSAHTYATVCIGIADAFISCWDEKYRSNYIRPVTVIREHIDPDWTPILYTPNFPEYPSGHSVVSGSAATILTEIFGENYAFIDSTEVPYGMAPRSFNSFIEASEEAAISRLYGGIHFMPAIENGKAQGRQVGKHVVDRLKLKRATR